MMSGNEVRLIMRFERMTSNFRIVIRIIMDVTVIVGNRASMLFIIKENRVSKHLSRKAREFLLSCFLFFIIINL